VFRFVTDAIHNLALPGASQGPRTVASIRSHIGVPTAALFVESIKYMARRVSAAGRHDEQTERVAHDNRARAGRGIPRRLAVFVNLDNVGEHRSGLVSVGCWPPVRSLISTTWPSSTRCHSIVNFMGKNAMRLRGRTRRSTRSSN
jgi:hypothetical protein